MNVIASPVETAQSWRARAANVPAAPVCPRASTRRCALRSRWWSRTKGSVRAPSSAITAERRDRSPALHRDDRSTASPANCCAGSPRRSVTCPRRWRVRRDRRPCSSSAVTAKRSRWRGRASTSPAYRPRSCSTICSMSSREPRCASFLVALIDATVPHVRWIVALRDAAALPVPRWLAAGLCDLPIEADELRVRPEEIAAAFARAGSPIYDDEALALYEATGGWALGLRVAGGARPVGRQAQSERRLRRAGRQRAPAFHARRNATASSKPPTAGRFDAELLAALECDARLAAALTDAELVYALEEGDARLLRAVPRTSASARRRPAQRAPLRDPRSLRFGVGAGRPLARSARAAHPRRGRRRDRGDARPARIRGARPRRGHRRRACCRRAQRHDTDALCHRAGRQGGAGVARRELRRLRGLVSDRDRYRARRRAARDRAALRMSIWCAAGGPTRSSCSKRKPPRKSAPMPTPTPDSGRLLGTAYVSEHRLDGRARSRSPRAGPAARSSRRRGARARPASGFVRRAQRQRLCDGQVARRARARARRSGVPVRSRSARSQRVVQRRDAARRRRRGGPRRAASARATRAARQAATACGSMRSSTRILSRSTPVTLRRSKDCTRSSTRCRCCSRRWCAKACCRPKRCAPPGTAASHTPTRCSNPAPNSSSTTIESRTAGQKSPSTRRRRESRRGSSRNCTFARQSRPALPRTTAGRPLRGIPRAGGDAAGRCGGRTADADRGRGRRPREPPAGCARSATQSPPLRLPRRRNREPVAARRPARWSGAVRSGRRRTLHRTPAHRPGRGDGSHHERRRIRRRGVAVRRTRRRHERARAADRRHGGRRGCSHRRARSGRRWSLARFVERCAAAAATGAWAEVAGWVDAACDRYGHVVATQDAIAAALDGVGSALGAAGGAEAVAPFRANACRRLGRSDEAARGARRQPS